MDYLSEYKRISKQFSLDMQTHDDVEGVMFLGGVARNRADKYSDIDIAVFSEEKLDWLPLGEQETPEGYDLEVFNIIMKKGYDDWSEIKREAYQEGIIDYDRRGSTKSFIENALKYPEDYQAQKTAELIFEIAWQGWIYTPFRGKKRKGYRWLLTENLWFYREFDKNVFYTAKYSLELFIELLFAVNTRWTPDYKWRYIRVKELPWLPTHFSEHIDCLLFNEWSEKTWNSQREKFQMLLDETIQKASEYLPEDWYSII